MQIKAKVNSKYFCKKHNCAYNRHDQDEANLIFLRKNSSKLFV